MWLLIPLLLINGIASGENFINKYRLDVGVPINILDVMLFMGLLLPLVPLQRNRFQARVHPALSRTVILYVLGAIAGSLGALICSPAGPWESVDSYSFLSMLRNFLTVPAAALTAYMMLQKPTDTRRYAFWYIMAGVGTAIMTMLFFHAKGEQAKQALDLNALRAMGYGPVVAGIAAVFLLWQIVSGNRQFSLPVALVLTGIAFVGQAATLSRSDWVSMSFAISGIYWLLPKGKRVGNMLRVALIGPVIAVFLVIGIIAASKVTNANFQKRIADRIESLLPKERETTKTQKAWDTRLESQLREVELWMRSPIVGNGFGHKLIYNDAMQNCGGYGHNTWTFTLFCAGPVAVAAAGFAVVGSWILGRRLLRDSGVGDPYFGLIGALCACSGAFIFMHGVTTASFNTPRPAIFLGLTFGIAARARAMQLQMMREQQELDAYYDENGHAADEFAPQEQYTTEPVFGGSFQLN